MTYISLLPSNIFVSEIKDFEMVCFIVFLVLLLILTSYLGIKGFRWVICFIELTDKISFIIPVKVIFSLI